MSGEKEVPWHTCTGQRTVCRSRFSPFIMFPGPHLTWHTWQKPPLTQGAVLLTLKFTSNVNRAPPPLSKKQIQPKLTAQQVAAEGSVYSLAKPFTMSRAYWLRSSVTDARRLEMAEGTERNAHQFQVPVPISPHSPEDAIWSLLFSSMVTGLPFASAGSTRKLKLCSSHQTVRTV